MVNKEGHLWSSGIATFLKDAIEQKQERGFVDLKQALASGIFGSIGGMIPDEIEPATNPNHRRFFHSRVNWGLISIGENILKQNPNIDPSLKKIILDVSFGYKTHLLVDSTTPKGLPLI